MKRTWAIVLSMMLMMSFLTVHAEERHASFSHPEVGEYMTVDIVDEIPSFQIYGFTYYKFFSPLKTHRGLYANQPEVFSDKLADVDTALRSLFDSVEGRITDSAPVVTFEYTGAQEAYQDALDALDVENRVAAMKILGGFNGEDGYGALKAIPGFENADIDELRAGYRDHYQVVDGARYPYRVLTFAFEEEKWEEAYAERYHFLQKDGRWLLVRTVKEYGSEYPERPEYLHGAMGAEEENLDAPMREMAQGFSWGASKDEVEAGLGLTADGADIKNVEAVLYRLPVTADFHFENGRLQSITYTLKNEQSYYSAFVSTYMRLIDPARVDENGDMLWNLDSFGARLHYDENAPTLTISYQ